MSVYYYFTVYPMEALIASGLGPKRFGSYMATGSKKGSAEKLIYIEVEQHKNSHFDWEYAQRRCKPRPDGTPKASVYLSVYRVLEHLRLDALKSCYLTTQDGRTLGLRRSDQAPRVDEADYYMYKELCPLVPIVVSNLNPLYFPTSLTSPEAKTWVPRIVYTDLKPVDLDDPENTGHTGGLFSRKLDHLKECLKELSQKPEKNNKIFERSHVEPFSYQIINRGIYVSDGTSVIYYPMIPEKQLREQHRDWAKSAMII
jgi:hypothetical protein